MLNRVYRLVAPHTVEPVVVQQPIEDDSVVVRPCFLSICAADQRYFQGRRPASVLADKLPMALVHEGVGRVVFDATGSHCAGKFVVMLPNDAGTVAEEGNDECVSENYRESSCFCGSGVDGFMQEVCVFPARRVLALPEGIDLQVAAFTELVSVAMHATSRFDATAHSRRDVLGVWGDGNVGFIVALALRMLFPAARVAVFGRNPYKLADFTFAETFLTTEADCAPACDHAFECCGGEGAAAAIEQIIDKTRPEGTVCLLGVSEERVPVNTRMVLEKGLRLVGCSRSARVDFEHTLAMFVEHPETVDYLRSLVADVRTVRTVRDISAAFDADARKPMGKTVLEWDV